MSIIKQKFEHKLKQSDIIIQLTNSSREVMGDDYMHNQPAIMQTSVYGIQSPLLMINNIVVDFSDVINFELTSIDVLPTVQLTVRDRYKLTSMFDTPGVDNELRLQILPKFDNKYKKINLTFYITNTRINGEYIIIKGDYKLSKFISSNIKSFGEISTYDLFEYVAKETGMGFSSNMEVNDSDKRWVYCDNKSYKELLFNEIRRSGSDLQICDYWVDWWNNLVLADIYERYNAVDKEEDMLIWIAGPNKELGEGIEVEPQQIIASFNNHPAAAYSELNIKSCSIINSPGHQMYMGTDHLYSVYDCSKDSYNDYLIQDGDVKNDVFTKYEYLGETYGGYNYLLANKKREAFMLKMKSNESIDIVLGTPLLGVMRGNRINVMWYINDTNVDDVKDKFEEKGLLNSPNSNPSLPSEQNEETNAPDGEFVLDRSISGQYLITGCRMKFINNSWEYHLILCRPTLAKPKIIKDNE